MACSEVFAKAIMDLSLGESEIHADVCRVEGFLKGCSIPQCSFAFLI